MKIRAQQVAIATFLTAGLITEAGAALDIQFLDNSSTTANFSTSPPNDPTFLNSLGSGFATYAGVLSGTGTVMKLGPGTITLTNANTYTGPTAVRTGTLHITGSISHASSGLYVAVASGDNGRAVINSGGTATVSLVSTAEDANSTADVTVSGSGSMLTVGNTMRIGLYGSGTLLVESGGKVDITSFGILGENAGSHGTATVTGLSQLTTGGNLYVGYGSLGGLSIQNGGHVSSAGGRIGENAGSEQT